VNEACARGAARSKDFVQEKGLGMGNYLIYTALVLFTGLWVFFADKVFFRVLVSLGIIKNSSEKMIWIWGVTLITLSLLVAFALMGISMAQVFSHVFQNPDEVSQKGIAVAILASLCASWLVSLNKFRARMEDRVI